MLRNYMISRTWGYVSKVLFNDLASVVKGGCLAQMGLEDDLQRTIVAEEEKTKEEAYKMARVEALKMSVGQYVKHAHDHHECYTCGRAFDNPTELQAFLDRQDVSAKNFPGTLRNLEVLC